MNSEDQGPKPKKRTSTTAAAVGGGGGEFSRWRDTSAIPDADEDSDPDDSDYKWEPISSQSLRWRNTSATPDEDSDSVHSGFKTLALETTESDDKWRQIKGGFYVKCEEDEAGRYRYSLEITGSSGKHNNSHKYVLFVLFNPPVWNNRSTSTNKTVQYLINITLSTGENSAFEKELKKKHRTRGWIQDCQLVFRGPD